MICVQFSRGMAPAEAIAHCANQCGKMGVRYFLVTGLPMVTAFNRAVEVSDHYNEDLLILPDDIVATQDHYRTVSKAGDALCYAPCPMWNGRLNVRYRLNGTVRFSGCTFLYLPRAIRLRLPPTVFECHDYEVGQDEELHYQGPNNEGKHADTHFWYLFNQLDPRPQTIELQPVDHLLHDHSGEHRNPSRIQRARINKLTKPLDTIAAQC